MQRQRSILSFLKKPPSEKSNSRGSSSGGAAQNGNLLATIEPHLTLKESLSFAPSCHTVDSLLEITGTETPPEKVPRQIFSADLTPNSDKKSTSLFSSIMHKFVKVDKKDKSSERNQAVGDSSTVCSIFSKLNECEEVPKVGKPASKIPVEFFSSRFIGTLNQQTSLVSESKNDMPGPETPGGQPFVPRVKRIREDCSKIDDANEFSLRDSSKRAKFLQDSEAVKRRHDEVSESASKFDWLDPSRIRDASGRRPGDPLHDKRTLHIPPDALKKMSASQRQYWDVKCQYMDVVLFFKVGKFYELYELDAEIGHKELDWKITHSGVGKCRQVGISESGIDDAVQKLVARGYKVGRMEQLETSQQAKARGANSVIRRKLVNVITPSTTDENIGPDAVHLLAVKEGSSGLDNGSVVFGFAFVDCAALKVWIGSVSDDTSCAALGALLMQVSPKEIIYESRGLSQEALKALKIYSSTGSTAVQMTPVLPVNGFPESTDVKNVIQAKGYFKGSSDLWNNLNDGVAHHEFTLCALGGLVDHLCRLMLDDVLCNGDVLPYQVYRGCLRMDGQTLVNLEIFGNNADGGPAGTLYKYLDSCITSSGKRLLKSWICHPLKDVEKINNRLNVVDALMMHPEIVLLVAQYLRKVPDLERLLGRVKSSVQMPATLLLPVVWKKVLKQRVKAFGTLVKGLRVAVDLLLTFQKEENLTSCLSKILDLPLHGGDDGLDKFLTQFEAAVDSDFPKYQDHDPTETDAETLAILSELFLEKASSWSQVIQTINCIDVLRSFAIVANDSSGAMSRPIIWPLASTTSTCQRNKGPTLTIKGLWHPFALTESGGVPVPNDIYLGEASDGYFPHTLLLTGPNMGGKSTLLRAACLSIILAQLGCYVPCDVCVLSLVDTIFTRLGATDRIMTGESTFYIECAETASVLQNATQDSLVLLDELGRGTSTFDGYAIAYAVFRHLVEKVNCRLLFATHYHPLTKEFSSHPRVTLKHMACTFKPSSETSSERDHELVFLYRLAPGACPESYGLQVALMAGVPKQVVKAASMAAQLIKERIGENFRSSERRSEFSTLHEEWFKTLTAVSGIAASSCDDDTYDTLFCLWHELRSSYMKSKASA
ncbi:DNA mismatch repair protein msh7 [Ancistrocladus abbreviatus]